MREKERKKEEYVTTRRTSDARAMETASPSNDPPVLFTGAC